MVAFHLLDIVQHFSIHNLQGYGDVPYIWKSVWHLQQKHGAPPNEKQTETA